jgi:hypothetical protein
MRDEATVAYRDVIRFFKNQSDHFAAALSPIGDGLLIAARR